MFKNLFRSVDSINHESPNNSKFYVWVSSSPTFFSLSSNKWVFISSIVIISFANRHTHTFSGFQFFSSLSLSLLSVNFYFIIVKSEFRNCLLLLWHAFSLPICACAPRDKEFFFHFSQKKREEYRRAEEKTADAGRRIGKKTNEKNTHRYCAIFLIHFSINLSIKIEIEKKIFFSSLCWIETLTHR